MNKDGGWSLPEIIDPPRKCICIPVPDEPFHRQAFFGALNELGWQHNWQRDPEHKAMPVSIVWNQIVREAMERFYSGEVYMCFSCEQLNECLAPLYELINDLTEQVEQLQQSVEENAAKQPTAPANTTQSENCGMAKGIVEFMNGTNKQAFIAKENSLADNAFEFIPQLIEIIPLLGSLPIDELFELANIAFETQVLVYNADYELIKESMICDLACFIEANDNEFTVNTWGDWLEYIDDKYPGNSASALFARYSPMRQTFLNQVLSLLNGNQSLMGYFEQIFAAGVGGALDPYDCTGDCDCNDIEWCKTWDLTADDGAFSVYGGFGTYTPGVGWSCPGQTVLWLYRTDLDGRTITSAALEADVNTSIQVGTPYDTLATFQGGAEFDHDPTVDTHLNSGFAAINNMAVRATVDGIVNYDGIVSSITICGTGVEPVWDT